MLINPIAHISICCNEQGTKNKHIKNVFNVLLFGLLMVSRARVVLIVFAKRLLTGPKSQVPLI